MKKIFVFAVLVGSTCFSFGAQKTVPESRKNNKLRDAELIAAAKKAVSYSLRDPDSAQFRDVFVSPNKVAVCGQTNAKNSYGGYEGFQRFIYTPQVHGIYGDGSYFVEARWEERCIIGTLDNLDERPPVLQ